MRVKTQMAPSLFLTMLNMCVGKLGVCYKFAMPFCGKLQAGLSQMQQLKNVN